jgi:hypothetical protein
MHASLVCASDDLRVVVYLLEDCVCVVALVICGYRSVLFLALHWV